MAEPEDTNPIKQLQPQGKSSPTERTKQTLLRSVRAEVSMSWSAPLPPPEALIKYNDAYIGCAKQIVDNAERQAEHRQKIEQAVIEGNLRSQHTGQWMAFTLALLILIGGFALIYLDKNILGTIFIATDIAGTVGIFLYGKRDQQRQLAKKSSGEDVEENRSGGRVAHI